MKEIPLPIKLITLLSTLTLSACGGGGGSSSSTNEATENNILVTNTAPIITSAERIEVDENINGIVYTATATDADNDNISFSIVGGLDQTAFSINSTNGELTFNQTADFESPTDANADGVYEVIIEANDSNDASDQLPINMTVNDVTQLTFTVSYPTPGANLGGGVELTSVTGFFEDLEDGEVLESDISSITVNGQPADIELPSVESSIQENTVRWRAQVPVTTTPNENTLNIELIDNSNNNQQVSQLLFNRFSFVNLQAITPDNANNRVLVLDVFLDALIAISDNGDRMIISDNNTGIGTTLNSPIDFTLDNANNRALVLDDNLDALISIDLDSGDRTIISDDNTGIGTQLNLPQSVTIDITNNRALILDTGLDALLAIDLDTGNRTIISDETTGTGSNFDFPQDIILDNANNQALIIDNNNGTNALIAVNLNNGNRSIISGFNTSFGTKITLDISNNRVIAANSIFNTLMVIDLNNGNQTIISDRDIDLAFRSTLRDITIDSANNRVLVADNFLDFLIAIDLDNGERTIVFENNTGNGTNLNNSTNFTGFTLDNVNNRALVIDNNLNTLIAINLQTGNRTILSNDNTSNGTDLILPRDIILDSANNRVLIVDETFGNGRLMAINLENGNRTIISDQNTGTGINLMSPRGVTLDSVNNRVFVVDASASLRAVIAINLDTGNRTIISDENTGIGTNLITPRDIKLDSANNRVLVVDPFLAALISIDLDSGDRTIISDSRTRTSTGSGINLIFPVGINLDVPNNQVLVADSLQDALITINLDSGERMVLSGESNNNETFSRSLRAISLDRANNRIFAVDDKALIVIDLSTGERAIASR